MRIIKKFIYPVAFSATFLILYISLTHLLTKVIPFPYGSYAPIAWLALFALAWVLFALPFYCVKYSKIIINDKFKYLFSAYNCLVLVIVHLLPFNLSAEESVGIIFLLWVIFWNALPLILRLVSRKNTENTTENETQI